MKTEHIPSGVTILVPETKADLRELADRVTAGEVDAGIDIIGGLNQYVPPTADPINPPDESNNLPTPPVVVNKASPKGRRFILATIPKLANTLPIAK